MSGPGSEPDPDPRAVLDPEREVMAMMLVTNVQMVAEVLRDSGEPSPRQVMRAIAATRSLSMIVDDTLRSLVDQARNIGHTWAEVGDVLHVTRQAAFQRFGGPAQPRTQDPEAGVQPVEGAADEALPILEHFLNERWDDVRARFDARMLDQCPVELLIVARNKVAAEAGNFQQRGTPTVSVRHRYTVVDIPIAFERADRTGRVVLNADKQVSGFFVLPPDAA